jgi:protein subunit release factor B
MKKRPRKRILSVTKKDFEIQTFRAGGKGGQHQNKRDTGVRMIHRDSGARGESREHKSQKANREAAFARLVLTDTFQTWLKLETAKRLQDEHEIRRRISRDVEKMMVPRNLRVEVKRDGRWVEAPRD